MSNLMRKCWNCGSVKEPCFDGGTPWCVDCGVVDNPYIPVTTLSQLAESRANWARELLLELEGVITPAVGEHHKLSLDDDGRLVLELSTVRDIAMRRFYLEPRDLQRNPPEIVADIVRSLNALPV